MSSQSPALTAAQAYFDALGKQDFDALKETLAADAVRKIYPEHLKVPDGNGRDVILQFVVPSWKVVRTSKFEIFETCVEGNKVWARAKATATLSNGEPFNPETVYMLETRQESDGVHRVSKSFEMVDTAESQKVMALMQLGK